jgi:aldose 1-epimerase
MPFAVHSPTRDLGSGRGTQVWVLEDGAGGQAEIWPTGGFNCFRWQVVRDGQTLDLLYADPDFPGDGRPTRSGFPILFPFPNRIRDGRFTWDGSEYQLPLNDGPKKNAIHGFSSNRAWQILDSGANDTAAWLTGVFQRDDHPELRGLWPAAFALRVTYRLGAGRLRIEAEVHNPDVKPLPFGLGYHPYFRVPFAAGVVPEGCKVQVPAASAWELTECLPTGRKQPPDGSRDLNAARRFTDLQLDDVLTDLPAVAAEDGLRERGRISAGGVALRLLCSDAYRDMVVYTPAHRQAFCIEPYTCVTDAVNLQARGVEAGWRVLPPGGRWSGVVELRVD